MSAVPQAHFLSISISCSLPGAPPLGFFLPLHFWSWVYSATTGSVCVDLAAETSSCEDALSHDLLARVLGQVDLEEASVGLRELLVATTLRVDLVPPALGWVRRQLGTTIDKLKVELLVDLVHLVENLPEPLDNLWRVARVVVGVLAKDVHVDEGLAHGTHLCVAPAQRH